MKLRIFTILLPLMFLGVTFNGFAQSNQPKVAVYVTGESSTAIKNVSQQKVTTQLVNSGKFRIIERAAEFLAAITKEQAYQQSGSVDDSQITRLGAQFGANLVCIVNINNYDTYIQVNTRMVDVEKAIAVSSGEGDSGDYRGFTDLEGVISKALSQMLGVTIGGGSSSSSNRYGGGSSAGGSDMTFTLPGGDTFKMVYVEGGSFTMGATSEQVGAGSDESPAHNVTLSSYYIAEFEVTQKLWQAVMGTTIYQQSAKGTYSTDLYGVNASYPMYYINHSECEEFIGRLNNLLRDKLPQGFRFRLPTEAQWEYAARGGKKAKNTLYAGGDYISEVAWYSDNSSSSTHTVGSKWPNELGIYDMSGNVWEWCADWYSSSYYSSSSVSNPVNLSSGSSRVLRGGDWSSHASSSRVAIRNAYTPSDRDGYSGMRVALVQ